MRAGACGWDLKSLGGQDAGFFWVVFFFFAFSTLLLIITFRAYRTYRAYRASQTLASLAPLSWYCLQVPTRLRWLVRVGTMERWPTACDATMVAVPLGDNTEEASAEDLCC